VGECRRDDAPDDSKSKREREREIDREKDRDMYKNFTFVWPKKPTSQQQQQY